MSDETMNATTSAPVTEAAVETGPAAAVALATGIGTFVLGIFTTLGEASSGVADWLQWNDRVGPLSGKTILAVIAFFASWAVLSFVWRGKSPILRPILLVTAVLVALGLIGTFPTFFQAFE